MAYIFNDLKTKLQTQVGDSNLSDSVAGDALNYTEQQIFNTFDLTLNSAQQTNSVVVATNTLASALPSNFQRVYGLYITAPVALSRDLTEKFVSPKDFRKQFPSPAMRGQSPLEWWTYFTSVEFANLSDQNYTVVLDYIKSITQMSASGDVPTVPAAFEELLMLGAKIRVYEQKEDFDYASQFQNRYADLLEAFITRYSVRQVDNQVIIPGARGRV